MFLQKDLVCQEAMFRNIACIEVNEIYLPFQSCTIVSITFDFIFYIMETIIWKCCSLPAHFKLHSINGDSVKSWYLVMPRSHIGTELTGFPIHNYHAFFSILFPLTLFMCHNLVIFSKIHVSFLIVLMTVCITNF
jgi:hypothetical protein